MFTKLYDLTIPVSKPEDAVTLTVRQINPGDTAVVEVFITRYKTKDTRREPRWSKWRSSFQLKSISVLAFGPGEVHRQRTPEVGNSDFPLNL